MGGGGYLRVERVSSKLTSAGDMAAIMAVLEFPPRFSLSSQVSAESRYGIYSPFLFFDLLCGVQ